MRSDLKLPDVAEVYRGKVRDVYHLPMAGRSWWPAIASARSMWCCRAAFRTRGKCSAKLSWHMLQATAHVAPNWAIASPDPNVVIGHRCETVKVEMVVRGYLAGHAWRTVQRRAIAMLCGAGMPEGLKENDALPNTVDHAQHQGRRRPRRGHHAQRRSCRARACARRKNGRPCAAMPWPLRRRQPHWRRNAASSSWTPSTSSAAAKDGRILLIDEVHTPDSSRYFYPKATQERQAKGERRSS
jgi:phosphoribosylaminoimidazole-succinocarboxamide synthase